MIVSAADDRSLWAVNLLTGACLTTLRGHAATG